MKQIGIISDTHGLLRPEAVDLLRGSDHIIHAGDIGNLSILSQLSDIAPVTAVKGNCDRGELAQTLPETQIIEVGGKFIYVTHDIHNMSIDPGAAGIDVVVSGHSHSPRIEHKNGTLYINPGSAGIRRFSLPLGVALIHIEDSNMDAKFIEILPSK